MKSGISFRQAGKFFKDYIFITLGIFLFVSAWCLFLLPNNLVGGGVSGMCAIIYYATGFPIGISSAAINAVLLVIAFFVIGRSFSAKTIYAIILTVIGFSYLPLIMPQEFITTFALNNGKLLCTIVGGAITGVGIGMAFTRGGSTGGTDIIAMMINKYFNVTPGKLLLVIDMIIISASLLIPSYTSDGVEVDFVSKVSVALYGLVLVGVNGYAVDLYITGSKQSIQIFIFSSKYAELANVIAFELNRGVTLLKSRGWYLKQESEVLTVLARKADLNMILTRIKEVDPKAFISVTSVMGVYGLGFDSIKSKPKIMLGKQEKGD